MTPLQQVIDDAAAQLLIKLAFLVPRGTDIDKALGPTLTAYKNAIYQAGQASQRERDAPYMQHKQVCSKWDRDYYGNGIEIDDAKPCTCGLEAIRSSSLTTPQESK